MAINNDTWAVGDLGTVSKLNNTVNDANNSTDDIHPQYNIFYYNNNVTYLKFLDEHYYSTTTPTFLASGLFNVGELRVKRKSNPSGEDYKNLITTNDTGEINYELVNISTKKTLILTTLNWSITIKNTDKTVGDGGFRIAFEPSSGTSSTTYKTRSDFTTSDVYQTFTGTYDMANVDTNGYLNILLFINVQKVLSAWSTNGIAVNEIKIWLS